MAMSEMALRDGNGNRLVPTASHGDRMPHAPV